MLENATEILVEVIRGPEVESIHRGALAVSDPKGRLVAWNGDPAVAAFVRSAAKPFQALSLFESGAMERFQFTLEELAVVIASHSGEPFHLDLVRSVMARAGLREEWLLCGVHPPFDAVARAALARAGERANVLHNNCSGKHAGMLAASIAMRVPLDGYIDPQHPVQQATRRRIAALADEEVDAIGVGIDGCSAPSFSLAMHAFATAFARLAEAGARERPERVPGLTAAWDAMAARPDIIAGNRARLDTVLMRAAAESGVALVAKAGAEGTYAMGVLTPEGPLGIALKIEDGAERARNAVAIEVLAQLGLVSDSMRARLAPYHGTTMSNHAGLPVGEIRPVFRLHR